MSRRQQKTETHKLVTLTHPSPRPIQNQDGIKIGFYGVSSKSCVFLSVSETIYREKKASPEIQSGENKVKEKFQANRSYNIFTKVRL